MSPVSQDSFSVWREPRGRRSGPAGPRGPGAEEPAAGEHDGPVLALVAAAAARAAPAGLKVAGGAPRCSEPPPCVRRPQPRRRTGLRSGRPACARIGGRGRVIVRPEASRAFDSSPRSPSGSRRPREQPGLGSGGVRAWAALPGLPPPPRDPVRRPSERKKDFSGRSPLLSLPTPPPPRSCFARSGNTPVFKAGGSRALAAQDSPTPTAPDGVRNAAVAPSGARRGR